LAQSQQPSLVLFHSATGQRAVKLTRRARLWRHADGKRDASNWNTVGAMIYNVYLFTGTPRSRISHRNNTDNSLNPKLNLPPGRTRLDLPVIPSPARRLNLELCFNDDPQARISVTARDGAVGEFSRPTTFSTGDSTATLTAIQTFSSSTDHRQSLRNKTTVSPILAAPSRGCPPKNNRRP